MKKRITLLLSALAVFTGTVGAVSAEENNQANLTYEEIAQSLKADGLLEGTDKGLELNKTLTRAEMCAIISRIVPKEDVMPMASIYNDMTDSHWAFNDISKLSEFGYVYGFEDGSFRPDEAVTAEQLAAILVRATGYSALMENNDIYPWYAEYMKVAEDKGILKNIQLTEENTPVTRDTAIAMYYNAINLPMVYTTGLHFSGGMMVPTIAVMDGSTEDTPLTTLLSEYKSSKQN